uniref:Thyroid hormone receptor interactor 10 n=1 Tax=Tetraodon nigroviridis TaxID=99883 RepID=H3CS60_TETNG
MDWGTDLWDQYDQIEKHTQSGIDLLELYIKFVKERTEIEQGYAKQLRNLTKKYAKRGSKDELDCKFSNQASFQDILNELNDYAGQRELVAENMMKGICAELSKYLQDLKQERKGHLSDAKKAQQNLESSFKQLESTKKRFAKEWAEAEKATQHAEKIEHESGSTKLDVEKAKQQAHNRMHVAEESRNDYAAQLQKYNKDQNYFYYTETPQIFNKMQEMDEQRIRHLAEGYCQFSDIEKKVLPIISKCLEGIAAAGNKINEKQDSMLFIEQHKSGFERPADVEFEDYTQGIKAATSDSSLNPPKGRPKRWLFGKKNKLPPAEDFSHLPPEQRKKKLQAKIDDINKELQKTQDQSEALEKMKGVYGQNPQLGDPSSLEPQISETAQHIGRLRGELAKHETWLSEAVGGEESANLINNNAQHVTCRTVNVRDEIPFLNVVFSRAAPYQTHNLYTEFDDEFEDVEPPLGQCTVLYNFEGNSEGTISIKEGELLSIMEEDKGDGWMRVQRGSGEEGFIPSSYQSVTLKEAF